MHTNPASFSPDLIAKIVRCVEDAVGDDIQADVQRNDLQTQNSVPSRIWDLLNTNIILYSYKDTPWPVGNAGGF